MYRHRLLDKAGTLELPIARSTLAGALRLAIALRELPKGTDLRRLPSTHQVVLIGAGDPPTIDKLATRALRRELSVVQTRDLVRAHKARQRGVVDEPRALDVVQTLEAALAGLVNEHTGRLAVRRVDVTRMDPADVARARDLVLGIERRLKEVKRLLRD